jgi:hypothetical protein
MMTYDDAIDCLPHQVDATHEELERHEQGQALLSALGVA